MKQHARALILALAALALGASITGLYVHYQMLANPDYTSFCDISSTVSCEAVLSSRFATMFGIPVAAGGAIWSALVLLLAAFGMQPASAKTSAGKSAADDTVGRVAVYIFVLSTIGLAAVLYLAYASFFILRTACPICMTMYVGVLGLFIVSGAAASGLAGLPGRMGRDLTAVMKSPLPATLAIVWIVASVSLVAFFPREQSVAAPAEEAAYVPPTEVLGADEISQFQAWMDAQPRVQVDVPRPEGAKVMVIKFNDYQCPACKQAYILYKSIQAKYEKEYPGQVAFVNVAYPLEAECNGGGPHSSACEAAVAVRLATEKNRRREMEAWLFDNQETLTRDRVKEGLAQIAQVTNFDERYKDELEKVKAEAQMGQKLQVTGTPTFFIDGIRIGSTLRPAYFDAAIAYELKKASASTS
jgi:uncharacterized membrane protein